MSLEEYYFHLSGFISGLIMASTKYEIYFANIISAETSEEFACLDKQNNKIKSSCPRSLIILLTQTMTCRLNQLMSLKLIGILWAFNWSYPTLPFLISSSRVFNGVLCDSLTYIWMWVIIYGVSLEQLLTDLKRICVCVCVHVFVQTGEGKALTSKWEQYDMLGV